MVESERADAIDVGKFSSTARARSRSGPSKIEKPRSSSDASSPRLRGLASRNRAKRLRTPAAPPIYVSLSYIRYNWQAFQRRVSLHAGINWGEAVVCQQGSKPVEASRNISQTVKRDKRDWQCTPLCSHSSCVLRRDSRNKLTKLQANGTCSKGTPEHDTYWM